jgi:prolyl-tRNA editing enzyme YbaK/EbsC (Cys-tRNA(Pro) deacylase)
MQGNMSKELSSNAQKMQYILKTLGFSSHVVELPDSTRTAREAAKAVGCRVEQIVKSLVFKGQRTNTPLLVVASGTNRVNEQRLSQLAGEPVEKADADFVRQRTGFAVGGVPPIGHTERLETFIDEDLLQYEELWASAGTPYAVFRLTPAELKTMTGGKVVSIT